MGDHSDQTRAGFCGRGTYHLVFLETPYFGELLTFSQHPKFEIKCKLSQIQYRTPIITNKKQESRSRLDCLFQNGGVLDHFSTSEAPEFLNFFAVNTTLPFFLLVFFIINMYSDPMAQASNGYVS